MTDLELHILSMFEVFVKDIWLDFLLSLLDVVIELKDLDVKM